MISHGKCLRRDNKNCTANLVLSDGDAQRGAKGCALLRSPSRLTGWAAFCNDYFALPIGTWIDGNFA
ncbi:hypothetical protein THIX_90229 [Thiomonas sp. X19]|nr:hypothetical protein THIX_90229 [Thiomonas sp. X19]